VTGADLTARAERVRASAGRIRLAAVVGTCVGMLLLVIGTFLPWLDSGSVSRTSYQAAGALRSLVHPDGLAGVVLAAWPFVSAAGAIAIALLVLRQLLLGAVVAALASLAAGAVAIATLAAPAHGLVQPARLGPVVTLLGSAVAILGAAATLIVLARQSGGTT
jgi:hypothetical protein